MDTPIRLPIDQVDAAPPQRICGWCRLEIAPGTQPATYGICRRCFFTDRAGHHTASRTADVMPLGQELTHLSQRVRDTFGEDAREDAIIRALAMMRKAQLDDVDAPFDADAVCYEALKIEFRRLLTEH
jgi:hypothetical protein